MPGSARSGWSSNCSLVGLAAACVRSDGLGKGRRPNDAAAAYTEDSGERHTCDFAHWARSARSRFSRCSSLPSPSAGAASAEGATGTYIVQMIQAPAATYDGWRRRDPGDEARKGEEVRRGSPTAAKPYIGHLEAAHDQALAEVGGREDLRLQHHVQRLRREADRRRRRRRSQKLPGVLSVEADVIYHGGHLDDAALPRPRRRRRASGTSSAARTRRANGKKDGAGENIIIGIIDSGHHAREPQLHRPEDPEGQARQGRLRAGADRARRRRAGPASARPVRSGRRPTATTS